MTVQSVADVGGTISKSEFERRRNVTPGRVTQWITAGKIDGRAIVGEGRCARIYEPVAIAQLNERIDVGQRFGNGLGTNLEPASQSVPSLPAADVLPIDRRPPAVESPHDPIEKQIARERLESLQRQNRKAAEDEAARAGRLVDTESVSQQYGRMAMQLLSVFEGALPEFASVVAAKYQIPQRDIVHLLRGEFRKVRAAAAATFRRAAGDMPDTKEFAIEPDQPEAVDA